MRFRLKDIPQTDQAVAPQTCCCLVQEVMKLLQGVGKKDTGTSFGVSLRRIFHELFVVIVLTDRKALRMRRPPPLRVIS